MPRLVGVICGLSALSGLGCADNPYVIGRYPGPVRDAGFDAGADARVDECADVRPGAVLCSGFEGESGFAAWADTATIGSATLERSSARAHTGGGSLHASSAGPMSAAIAVADFAPLIAGELHLRAYLYVPANVPTQIMNIFFLGSEPGPEPFQGMDFNLQDGAVQVFSPQNDPTRQTGSVAIPRDRWFCFRAQVVIDDTRGSVQVFVDDQLALDAQGLDTLPEGGVRQLRAGVDWSSEQEAYFEIYLDDILLDTSPVSCVANGG